MGFETILLATIPVFLIVGAGFLCRRLGIINDVSEKSIISLILNLLYPCFILSRVPGNESLREASIVATAIGAGFGLTITGMIVAYLIARVFGINQAAGRNTFCLSSSVQNYGFIPIPLIEALFPKQVANETLGLLFVHNLGLEIAVWTIGIVILSGTLKGASRRLINGPTIAIVAGLILNFTGLYVYIPGFLNNAISQLGQCSIPISLVLVGATICGVLQKESWNFEWKVSGGATLARFLIMPILFWSVAWLISFSDDLKRVLIIEAAMPAAIFPIVLAKHFGGKPAVATQIVLVTSAISIGLTPLILMLGLNWFGLSPSP